MDAKDKRIVVGIDPSIAGSAVSVIKPDGHQRTKRFGSKNQGDHIRGRLPRYLTTIDRMIEYIGEIEPDVICIEGYSFGSDRQNFLAEFGGILRADLCAYETDEIFEVAPTTFKKFVTGNGKAEKHHFVPATLELWNVGFATHDEFDAHGLARMAMCIAGWAPPTNKKQAECLYTVTKRKFEVGEVCQPTLPFKAPF